ncbi:MAG: 23S rRNA (pseudouridine(1915)-N(3))-methyltransferase RlmH [Gammaproteobacteria bacterium]|nr:23S rRNA (pseudouridine(1915)-N(3))-methyltransferase RlmH [Gammaproteobacteria bacterium]
MKINLVAIGTRMPGWVSSGVSEYQKRLPTNFELIVTEIPLARRSKANQDVVRLCREEGKALLNAVSGDNFLVALDVKGKNLSTEEMAEKIGEIRDNGQNIALLVGGPDGLSRECLDAANAIWSLSALTLPHTIVRIVVAEQIYRVWSVLAGHPYHRE